MVISAVRRQRGKTSVISLEHDEDGQSARSIVSAVRMSVQSGVRRRRRQSGRQCVRTSAQSIISAVGHQTRSGQVGRSSQSGCHHDRDAIIQVVGAVDRQRSQASAQSIVSAVSRQRAMTRGVRKSVASISISRATALSVPEQSVMTARTIQTPNWPPDMRSS